MANFIDRRLNPKDKSLGNRRRFLKRVRSHIKRAVDDSVRERGLTDVERGEKVSVPTKGIEEPVFRRDPKTGKREHVLSGNKQYIVGDKILKPGGGAGAGSGKEGSNSGEGEDEFVFALSRDEFIDLFFEDLELPDLIKHSIKEVQTYRPRRAGYSVSGSPNNINVLRTMRNSLGRRLALKRPDNKQIKELQAEVFKLEKVSRKTKKQQQELARLHAELEELLRRQRVIAFIDPLDVRYNYFEHAPEPNANAVMFCLMDTSASMGEREKDLAKRFFILLHLFLKRRYKKIDLVFVRHTHNAQEVDEEAFFYSRETGGTVVSTALKEMKHIIDERYPPYEWNIYAAQASDGENFAGDTDVCVELLKNEIMPVCQYYAYIEILEEAEAKLMEAEENGMELWRGYRTVKADWQNFAMKRISTPSDIYPVFRQLFAKKQAGAQQ
ncbi:YeaH/YhbH family protein [Rhodobacteraceae bacterium RKSG542]|uniref:YeaH/YhbH family protein n=1 Tax=Pseudovibrio flavus TaxID=2529854 RepID=UPI0012BB7DCC|nr:YeaH/YhbH family protein [Pseudovibrio flavus]MTI18239.1 YeaH/YhbH family protein [Pseudovibrio flavus]